ncbi:Uncharacterised protein [Shigella sonnei]|nr:Uncharacterised protein [Shigella sonnei]
MAFTMAVVGVPLVTLYVPGCHIVVVPVTVNGLRRRLRGGRLQGLPQIVPRLRYHLPQPFYHPVSDERDGQRQPAGGCANIRVGILYLVKISQRYCRTTELTLQIEVHGMVQDGEQDGPHLQIGDSIDIPFNNGPGQGTHHRKHNQYREKCYCHPQQYAVHHRQCVSRNRRTGRLRQPHFCH